MTDNIEPRTKPTYRQLNAEQMERLEQSRREWEERLRPYSESIRRSRPTGEDYLIRINI